jgi:ATP-binding cassette subfamily F protein uup
MALISLNEISISFGDQPLLENARLQLESGERVCLLGRNGTGKSTLMKMMAGDQMPDSGHISPQKGIRIALLGQEVPAVSGDSIRDLVSENTPETWTGPPVVETILSKMDLDGSAEFKTLSVGMKRRSLLARALATQPDLLLLDEPTNHLDIEAILWMEDFLLKRRGALCFITHDRALTQRLATRIVEIELGELHSWECDYPTYLKRREAKLEVDAASAEQFDRKLSEEEIWVRQGIKARRTRNEGRVRALKQMREERSLRRESAGDARIAIQEGDKTSKRVIEAEGLTFGYDETPIIRDFSTTVMRGDKIGFIGPNGSGKTTLLRMLLGDLKPQSGVLTHGLRLEVAYFDQVRAQLDDNKTVFDTVANGSDRVTINGKDKHVFAYLQDFLFPAARARSLVRVLSGGERNRLLLAKLFATPSNVLALDEPTNDLDAETLEILESTLVDFSGTVLVVSHDRTFLDNVVTTTIAFDAVHEIHEYVGGYTDFLRQHPEAIAESRTTPDRNGTSDKKKPAVLGQISEQDRTAKPRNKSRKLSNKEREELKVLPDEIDTLEAEKKALHEQMSDPSIYLKGGNISELRQRLEAIDQELETSLERWEKLDALNS